VDPAGRFWAGSLIEQKKEASAEASAKASAGLYCLERGQARAVTGAGAASPPWRDWGVRTANGLAFSPDGRIMYHCDTPAHTVYAYDYDAGNGAIDNRRIWWRTDDDKSSADYGGRPDGAAVDVDGCYWTAQYEGGRILQLSPDGRQLRALAVPARCPTMVTFGGADLRTLYITSARHGRPAGELKAWPHSGFVFAVPVAVAGLPANTYVR
jgi:sugar lactone lactonase YvrE